MKRMKRMKLEVFVCPENLHSERATQISSGFLFLMGSMWYFFALSKIRFEKNTVKAMKPSLERNFGRNALSGSRKVGTPHGREEFRLTGGKIV